MSVDWKHIWYVVNNNRPRTVDPDWKSWVFSNFIVYYFIKQDVYKVFYRRSGLFSTITASDLSKLIHSSKFTDKLTTLIND